MEDNSINDIIDRSTLAVTSLFEQKGLKLIKDMEKDLPKVHCDRDRIIQVVINLLSNAVKFTPSGMVACLTRKSRDAVTVSVIDQGIGIAKEHQDKVFDKFKQNGDTLTDKPKGTGLGLPICKQIVESHGGKIWVESEPGVGSTFSFTLPAVKEAMVQTIDMEVLVKQLTDHTGTLTAPLIKEEKRILVVDDDDNIRTFFRQELEAAGYSVLEAREGLAAINLFKREKVHLILLDVMMPGMNGFDVAAILKNDPATMDIPIVILSIVEDKERGYRIGIDRYFTKPVNTEKLLGEIGILLSQGNQRKKVLVVDENNHELISLSEALKSKGYTVSTAANHEESIEKATREKPDVIVVNRYFKDIIPGVKYHHERYDGKGYPEGLRGEEIDIIARIIAVGDTFDAMTTDRPYRKGLSDEIAFAEIKKNAGSQFDPVIAEAFLKAMEDK